eukprot:TRINITY_DN9706_c0_g1_i1.p1 TRINITY_DN9706_c0_g1~~TRINITY_DN9706_c0_g1_i1.p1  ORF type:complete len:442 (-),score=143.35 TRINITY_DN9706_c0_g1_i1:171-1496(-)
MPADVAPAKMDVTSATPKKTSKAPKVSHRKNPLSGLASRLEAHATVIDGFVDLIPAKFYFPIEFTEEQMAHKFAKNKKNKAPKQEMKETSRKGKRARLDPANAKSNAELQVERKLDSLAERDESDDEDDDESEGSAEDDAEEADESTEDGADETHADSKPSGWLGTLLLSAGKDQSSTEQLRSRLQQRIEELRAKRKAPEKSENGQQQPRKKQKKQAEEEKEKARKERQKQNKKGKQSAKKEKADGAPPVPEEAEAAAATVEEGDFSFSKFDFSTGQAVPSYLVDHAKKKKKASTEELLKRAQQHKLLIDQIKGTEEGEQLMKRDAFKSMFAKAQGEKVKDNPALLKKTLKREQKQKKKSSAAWAERKSLEKKSQKERQEKRQKNIDEKRQKNKDRRMGKKSPAKPKGPRRPGFEGRKKGFLNKKGGAQKGGGGSPAAKKS